jgi:hypothetical protein
LLFRVLEVLGRRFEGRHVGHVEDDERAVDAGKVALRHLAELLRTASVADCHYTMRTKAQDNEINRRHTFHSRGFVHLDQLLSRIGTYCRDIRINETIISISY